MLRSDFTRLNPGGNCITSNSAITLGGQESAAVAYSGGQYLAVRVEGTDEAYTAKDRLISSPTGQLGDMLTLSQNESHFYDPINAASSASRGRSTRISS